MNHTTRGLLVVFCFAPFGLWGCAQERNGANAGKIRDLTARNAKLEEDYKVAVSISDGFRKRLAVAETRSGEQTKELESQLHDTAKQLQDALNERDELRKQVATRTGERDVLHGQLIEFGKDLQVLAGKIDAAVNARAAPATTTAATAPRTSEPAAQVD